VAAFRPAPRNQRAARL